MRFDTRTPNPTWRLHVPLRVTGLDGKDDHLTTLTVNLHTGDEVAAQLRGIEAVESLHDVLNALRQRYPEMYWKRGVYTNPKTGLSFHTLQISDVEDHTPVNPDPENLHFVHDDMAHCRTNFRVARVGEPVLQPDGRLRITLGIERGTRDMGDLTHFKGVDERPVLADFTVDPHQLNKVDRMVAAVSSTFEDNLQMRYSNRMENESHQIVRQPREQFQPQTIHASFIKALSSELEKAGLASPEELPLSHARRVRSQELRIPASVIYGNGSARL